MRGGCLTRVRDDFDVYIGYRDLEQNYYEEKEALFGPGLLLV